jgi:putative ABC transport system ATP-binding protein
MARPPQPTPSPDVVTAVRPPPLEGQHLTHVYGEGEAQVTALSDVSLALDRGEVVLLMGPSGSGKSTLLAILSGLLRPTAGRVLALGQDLAAMSERERERFRLRHCGFIFQEYNLLPALTACQQLEIVLRWGQGVPAREARARADAMLERLGLARQAALMPLQLSGGEKQRVAIGRGLVKDPTFCFADEPTGALDWRRGEQVVELLRCAAHDRGVGVLIVAHDERIIPYADRVLCLEDGRLHAPGAAELAVSHRAAADAVPPNPGGPHEGTGPLRGMSSTPSAGGWAPR